MGRTTGLRRLVAIVLTMLVSVTLVACSGGGPSGSGSSTTAKKRLVIGATASPDSMDPTTSTAAAIPQVLLYNVYETLVKVDSSGAIKPLLAAEWMVSNDRTVYTFKLHPGAKFASGNPLNADAVVASIERIKNDPNVLAVCKREMSVVTGARAVDSITVEVTLSEPSNNWLYYMTQRSGIIIDPASFDNLASTPAGSGPLVLGDWRQGESVTLERNQNYWGTGSRFDEVVWRYFTDSNAQNTAMLSVDLDIISNVTAPEALTQFENDSRFHIIEGTTNGEIVLGFNNARAPLTDVRVRQAITYAIDRKGLVDSVWAGKGTLIGSMVPPTDPWYEDLSQQYPFDPAKARELLAEAGYANGLQLSLRVPTRPYATGAAQYIVSQLRDVGVTAVVEELEFPSRWVDEVMVKSNYDMTIVAHVEGRDIIQFADPNYYWHYNNPQFQELIKAADAGTQEQQIADMKQAARMLSDDAAADFLWLLPNLIVTKSTISGVQPNATGLSFDLTAVASSS